MDWNWLSSALYGVLSGFSQLLPVSPAAHRLLLTTLMGVEGGELPFRLMSHFGILLGLLILCQTQLAKLRRERRIASIPHHRRKRAPDVLVLTEYRLLKTALLPLAVMTMLYLTLHNWQSKLWILALVLVFHGVLLYIPQFLPQGNKDIHTVSGLDAMLTGLTGGLGWIPGMSFLGGMIAAMQGRGADKPYLIQFSVLLLLPAVILLILSDIYFMIASAAAMSARYILLYMITLIFSAVGAYLGGLFLRFLSAERGFSGFAYYNWGMALVLFILFLTI